jgi:release factor glutamine methyltransferase
MHSPDKKKFFSDCVFEVCEEVYEPSEDTFLFAENLHVKAGTFALDMGTGIGILGITAAKQGAEVVALDINPHSIHCAKQNARRNKVSEKMAFLQTDLFSGLCKTVKFDLILFNSPYLPSEEGEDKTWLGRAWAGGASGRQVIDKFITQAPGHLESAGEILLLQSTLAGVEQTKKNFRAVGMKAEIAASRALPFFETLVLLKASFIVERP